MSAVARPGVFTRNTDAASRRRERMNQVAAVNRVLKYYGIMLADWQGSAFILSSATGKTEIVDNLAHLWTAAERLLGQAVRSARRGTDRRNGTPFWLTPRLDFTPVTLITGFLGSGKTTLLQRLLRDPALSDTAVLVNEFGEIGLDHHLLERIDETMVMLQSGCVCCTIRGELSTAIKDLHSRRERGLLPPFRRLVIESTGLADPFPILSTVRSDPVLRHHFCLGNVITTVDAVNGARQLDAQPESVKQVAIADRLVLTKTDLTAAEVATRLTRRLRHINPGAPLWRAAEDELDAAALLSGEDHEACRPAACHDALPDDHHRTCRRYPYPGAQHRRAD